VKERKYHLRKPRLKKKADYFKLIYHFKLRKIILIINRRYIMIMKEDQTEKYLKMGLFTL